MSVGTNIKVARVIRGLTISQLARLADISVAALWNYEHDKTTPSDARLHRLARALMVDDFELRYGRKRPGDNKVRIVFPTGWEKEAEILKSLLKEMGFPIPKQVSLRRSGEGPAILIDMPKRTPRSNPDRCLGGVPPFSNGASPSFCAPDRPVRRRRRR